MINVTVISGVLAVVAFLVTVIVQVSKDVIPLPTKAWVILVSLITTIGLYIASIYLHLIEYNTAYIILAVFSAFIVAYIAMYGFDTLKELYDRFKINK